MEFSNDDGISAVVDVDLYILWVDFEVKSFEMMMMLSSKHDESYLIIEDDSEKSERSR